MLRAVDNAADTFYSLFDRHAAESDAAEREGRVVDHGCGRSRDGQHRADVSRTTGSGRHKPWRMRYAALTAFLPTALGVVKSGAAIKNR